MADHEKTEKSGPKVKVVLREGIHLRLDEQDRVPGDTVEVDADTAKNLVDNGLADREGDTSGDKADAEQAKAEAEARDAADEIEKSKARSIEQTNAERIVPAAPQRRGPGRPRSS